jgi:pilus assembly protein CpaF
MSTRDQYRVVFAKQNSLPIRLATKNANTDVSPQENQVSVGSSYSILKHQLHQRILRQVDITQFDLANDKDAFKRVVQSIVADALASSNVPLTREEKERLAEDTIAEAVGLGPLGPLLDDPAVSDILVNGAHEVFVERFGKLELTSVRFRDNDHLLNLIERIVSRVGRHIDQNSPMVDARLPDGSRVNAIIPPLSLSGPVLSIRRFGHKQLTTQDLVKLGAVPEPVLQIFQALVHSRHNIQVSGGTGSGKTTLLNALSSFIDSRERIITIEDAAELQLRQEHVVRLEARPPNIEGKGKVSIRELVINSLRMRPDRIIVGEVRGGEAFDMLQAMSTGHDGSMTTVHSNSSRDSLKRLEAMVLMAGFELPSTAIRQIISSALEILIHVERMSDGTRRVTSVSEVVGMERETMLIQDIFVFEQLEVRHKQIIGRHVATGVRPQFLKRCELLGYRFDSAIFQRGRVL